MEKSLYRYAIYVYMIRIVHSILHANKKLYSLHVRISQIESLSTFFGSSHNPCTPIGIYRNYFANLQICNLCKVHVWVLQRTR